MEQETLFTSSKWDILKCLEFGKKSPLDLAKETNTSVANISQQLRLLELAGFVKSERISNRDKGLPRILYSISKNYCYLISSMPGFVDKKFLVLQDYQKCTLKIWFLDNVVLQRYVEKFFWNIEKYIDKIDVIAIDSKELGNVKVFMLSNNADVKKLKDIMIDGPNGSIKFSIFFIKEQDVKKSLLNTYVIHDIKNLVNG
ncbi:MAG: helix-turn-helix domain-containing protein [Candidatus Woesearchaeota archaeon]